MADRSHHMNGYVPLPEIGEELPWNADLCACGAVKDRRARRCYACYAEGPKRCPGCGETKARSEYYRRSATGQCLPRCKDCVSADGRSRCRVTQRRYRDKSRSRPGYYKQVAARLMHRRATDPLHKLADNLRRNLRQCIQRHGGKKHCPTLVLLGCSVEEFRAHIERQWRPGMSWTNWGRYRDCWQLDHIRPVASFDLDDPAQVAECFHFSNYQPLWALENAAKGARH